MTKEPGRCEVCGKPGVQKIPRMHVVEFEGAPTVEIGMAWVCGMACAYTLGRRDAGAEKEAAV